MLADLERRDIVVREGRQLAVLVGGLEALIKNTRTNE
jgi:hypothetical protein